MFEMYAVFFTSQIAFSLKLNPCSLEFESGLLFVAVYLQQAAGFEIFPPLTSHLERMQPVLLPPAHAINMRMMHVALESARLEEGRFWINEHILGIHATGFAVASEGS
jgi:hypothetical protein